MSKLYRSVKSSGLWSDAGGNDPLANLPIADEPLLVAANCNAGAHVVMAGAPPITQIGAALPSTAKVSASLTQVLYLQEAGDTSLISVRDINQGQMGDCFLLSSIGEIAL